MVHPLLPIPCCGHCPPVLPDDVPGPPHPDGHDSPCTVCDL